MTLNAPGSADEANTLVLSGLDGSNPLAFLAALGVVKALEVTQLEEVKMSWAQGTSGQWNPKLSSLSVDRDAFVDMICTALNYGTLGPSIDAIRHRTRFIKGAQALGRAEQMLRRKKKPAARIKQVKKDFKSSIEASRVAWLEKSHRSLLIGDNTNIEATLFREHSQRCLEASPDSRLMLDMLAALGSEMPDEKGVMQDTALRTMSGAGHQHFLRFASNLLAVVNKSHLTKSMFQPWMYDDPVRNFTLRLDPIEDARYAFRWSDPSKDTTRNEKGSMLGGNALAVLGLSNLPTVPIGTRVQTVGFIGRGAKSTFWRWPIWETPITGDVVRTLMCNRHITEKEPNLIELQKIGVAAVYQSQRLTVGKFRNFAPSKPLS